MHDASAVALGALYGVYLSSVIQWSGLSQRTFSKACHDASFSPMRRADREQFATKSKAIVGQLCQGFPLAGAPGGPVYVVDRNGARQYLVRDRGDVVEMMQWNRNATQRSVRRDGDDRRIGRME